jgi:hypothetical protein
VIRVLAVLIAIAAGIRIIYWLLLPVWPYLLTALIVFAVVRIAGWYRGRW